MSLSLKQRSNLGHARDLALISFGALVYTIGFVFFQLPYQITMGGVSGIAALIYYTTGFPASATYLIANILLFAVALRILGWKFLVNTVYAVLLLTVLMAGLQELITLEDGTLMKFVGEERLLACILGAVLDGMGLGIIFLNNGSTGGTDIVAAIINKYRDISLGQGVLFADLLIISSSYFVFHNVELLIFGYCTMIIETTSIDAIMNTVRRSIQVMVYSTKSEEIAEAIVTHSPRGVTLLDAHGWYSKTPMKVLVCLCRRRESGFIMRTIREIDPGAFVSQCKVQGVYGNGFDNLRA